MPMSTCSFLVWVIQDVQSQIHSKNQAGENSTSILICTAVALLLSNHLNCRTVAGTCRQPEQHLTLASQGLNYVCVTHDQIDKQTEYAAHCCIITPCVSLGL